jgi:LPXTG-motif cell wall-anchored protein
MLSPKTLGSPTPGATFVDSTLRIWNARTNAWSTTATTPDGTWEVMGDQVRFSPRRGFLGVAVVPFSITDTTGVVMGAMLTVDIADGIQVLPATGTTMTIMMVAALLLLGGFALVRRRPPRSMRHS